MNVDASDDFKEAEAARAASPTEKESAPVVEIIRTVPGRLLVGIGTYLFGNAGFFMLTTFMISYVVLELDLPSTVILNAITWGAVAQIVCMFVAGKVADKTSPSAVVVVGYVIAALVAFPIFWLVDTRSAAMITVALILGLGFASIAYATVGTVLTQLFPVKIRYSAIALSANLAGIVAGFMPALAQTILSATGGGSLGPAILLFTIAVISLVSSIIARILIRRDDAQGIDHIGGELLNRT